MDLLDPAQPGTLTGHLVSLDPGDCASCALAKTRNLSLLLKANDFPRTGLTAAVWHIGPRLAPSRGQPPGGHVREAYYRAWDSPAVAREAASDTMLPGSHSTPVPTGHYTRPAQSSSIANRAKEKERCTP